MDLSTRTHTALHVLKGAVQKVLGAKWTSSVYARDDRGRLTVSFDRKPTREELGRIEALANEKIREDQEIEEFEMEREEAEERWGEAIYDLFPLPPHIRRIKILNIEGWNVNACKERHCKTTGEVGGIKITKTRFRKAKQLLEISFTLETS
ncbi:MAG: alanyl-tRNA editing protein [Candidatus Bathyarchaeia archaeon]